MELANESLWTYVCQLYVSHACNQHVIGLQISMNHAEAIVEEKDKIEFELW